MCLFPMFFPMFSLLFALACVITTVLRLRMGWDGFTETPTFKEF
jgi:hypothetical protein